MRRGTIVPHMTWWTLDAVSAAGSALGGLAAAGALAYTGIQVRHATQERRAQRAREIEGVSVSWIALEAPDHAGPDGTAQWFYEFRVDNPGGLPIDSIEATVHLPVSVRRVRYSGRLGDPTTTLKLRAPVIPAHGDRRWKRRLVIPFDARSELRTIYAEVSFSTVAGDTHVNRWPRRAFAGRPVT